jgi:hypothetical protein
MRLTCPICGQALSLFALRSQFNCPSCRTPLKSNVRVVEFATILGCAIASLVAPTEQLSKLGQVAVYIGIGVIGVVVGALFLRLSKAPHPEAGVESSSSS